MPRTTQSDIDKGGYSTWWNADRCAAAVPPPFLILTNFEPKRFGGGGGVTLCGYPLPALLTIHFADRGGAMHSGSEQLMQETAQAIDACHVFVCCLSQVQPQQLRDVSCRPICCDVSQRPIPALYSALLPLCGCATHNVSHFICPTSPHKQDYLKNPLATKEVKLAGYWGKCIIPIKIGRLSGASGQEIWPPKHEVRFVPDIAFSTGLKYPMEEIRAKILFLIVFGSKIAWQIGTYLSKLFCIDLTDSKTYPSKMREVRGSIS